MADEVGFEPTFNPLEGGDISSYATRPKNGAPTRI